MGQKDQCAIGRSGLCYMQAYTVYIDKRVFDFGGHGLLAFVKGFVSTGALERVIIMVTYLYTHGARNFISRGIVLLRDGGGF